ncbi:MAG: UDP-N-acetylglucosamine 2-epimerase [Candidatus Aenigmarchaeota archaeon]|nr:UDP-N-acetylglucosamine 2-epimerase [Candidatus Aenigmarchaeota archaeon]
MIYITLGSKAQLIKMAPIMVELNKQNIKYRFIFTGQHKETIKELIDVFGLRRPDYTLYKGKDITQVFQMASWSVKCLVHTARNKKKIFPSKNGIVLVHGDAFSALLGAMMAKMSGLKVGYVEAGLRSNDIWNPFPEEITRRIVSRMVDYHFCQDEAAMNNSKKYGGKKINTRHNTLYDALMLAVRNQNKINVDIPGEKYGLVSIHRYENISSEKRLDEIVRSMEELSKNIRLLFILHKPTRERLKKYGIYGRIKKNPNIELRPRYDYFRFIKLVWNAEFVITDGGSNQEECSYLGKPCLLMRSKTERFEGLGKNTVISNYNRNVLMDFVKNYHSFKQVKNHCKKSPSKIIVNAIADFK